MIQLSSFDDCYLFIDLSMVGSIQLHHHLQNHHFFPLFMSLKLPLRFACVFHLSSFHTNSSLSLVVLDRSKLMHTNSQTRTKMIYSHDIIEFFFLRKITQ
ncbi:groucho protein [Sarcoptes scabiei]|nr:groucho protein [Sarcoptes scabiei]